jgi:hypothetical protein
MIVGWDRPKGRRLFFCFRQSSRTTTGQALRRGGPLQVPEKNYFLFYFVLFINKIIIK